jgi:hypothetical protein
MDHTATLLPDGRVMIVGGFNGDGGPHTLSSCEIFDPETDSFLPAPDLPLAVHEHRATLLPDGDVLITGGMFVDETGTAAVNDTFVLRPEPR